MNDGFTEVYLCSPTNSTMFTCCCDVAITDSQKLCPNCEKEATSPSSRWFQAYKPVKAGIRGYGNHGRFW